MMKRMKNKWYYWGDGLLNSGGKERGEVNSYLGRRMRGNLLGFAE